MNKTALITGASNGIGYELAKVHAENGNNLVLVARSKNKLDELKKDLEEKNKIKILTIGKDLSNPDSAKEVYDEIRQQNISVDYLINNAGFGDFGFFADSDWTKQKQMINLNIMTLAQFTHLLLPEMIKKGGCKILNVASTASFQPGPTMSVYFATKAFVLSFSEAINNEVRDKGLTVTALCPGPTESGFHAVARGNNGKAKERKMPSSREVAEYGYKAMMKGKSVAVPGFRNAFMAAAVRFMPRSLVVKAVRSIQTAKHTTRNS